LIEEQPEKVDECAIENKRVRKARQGKNTPFVKILSDDRN
jgi:hypothetical protein